MARIYKKQIIEELANLKPIDTNSKRFQGYLDKVFYDQHKIILFRNYDKERTALYCTHCKTWRFFKKKDVKHIKKGDKIGCFNCGPLEVIHPRNNVKWVDCVVFVTELNKRKEIILRAFHITSAYVKETFGFERSIYEILRVNINRNYAVHNNIHSNMYHIYFGDYGNPKPWREDKRWSKYISFDWTYQTPKEIKRMISKTEYKYSCLDLVVENEIDARDYLTQYKKYPELELLIKSGCYQLVKDVCSKDKVWLLKGLSKKEMNITVQEKLNLDEVKFMKNHQILDKELIQKGLKINYETLPFGKISENINYLFEKKYHTASYRDYLRWCNDLGCDMSDKKVLYPDDPQKAHDEAMKKHQKFERKIFNEKIKEYAEELHNFVFKDKKYMIFPAHSQNELIEESKALKHCVRSYAERMANRQCCIMLIREKEHPETPYVTLELREQRVIQCRGYNNCEPNIGVKNFVNHWCKKNELKTCFKEV